MHSYRLVYYPNKVLRSVSVPLELEEDFKSDYFKDLLKSMESVLDEYKAHGLAAVQLGEAVRVFCMNVGGECVHFINPKIVDKKNPVSAREGCLSFPGVYENVSRYQDIILEYTDPEMETVTVNLTGVEAVGAQHEIDHLDGVLFIDHVSNLKKQYMLKKLAKIRKKHGL